MKRLLLATVLLSGARLSAADILFLAGPDTHAWGQHKHYAGSMLLAASLTAAVPELTTEVVREFPSAEQLSTARGLVIYADGHQFHPANGKLPELEAFLKAGKGVTVLHWATGIAEEHSPLWRTLVGAGFEARHSVSRIWTGEFSAANKSHPVLRGVNAFRLHDECYFHLNFAAGPGLDPLLTSLPPGDVLEPSGEHAFEGNSKVRASVIDRKEPQAVAWAYTRPQGGRAFGFTGGHFHWSWARSDVRRLALNGIAWTAGLEIPDKGLESPAPTAAKMLENLSGTNLGWTAEALADALARAENGEVVPWKQFEDKPLPAPAAAADFRSIFDGKSLEGWKARDMSYWSVRDGAITGQSTAEHPCKTNQFMVWQGGDLADFEMKLKFRVSGNGCNSGVQFRSVFREDGLAVGYQADIYEGGGYLGGVCDELHTRKGEELLTSNGKKTVIDADGRRTATDIGHTATLKAGGWNDYHILANGHTITLSINGVKCSELTDHETGHFDLKGSLGLQLRAGEPMTVQFKDIMLRKL